MHIERATLPPGTYNATRNYKYADLFTAIKQSPEWHAVSLTDIGGDTPAMKQKALHSCAKVRHLQVQTRVRGERMFIRVRPGTLTEGGN